MIWSIGALQNFRMFKLLKLLKRLKLTELVELMQNLLRWIKSKHFWRNDRTILLIIRIFDGELWLFHNFDFTYRLVILFEFIQDWIFIWHSGVFQFFCKLDDFIHNFCIK